MKQLKDKSVLIVDDYEINIQVLKLILDRFGLVPDIATNGIEAIEKFQQTPYQVIFMDLMMPDMDGYDATKKIRLIEKERDLERAIIIAVSANYGHDDNPKFIDAGFNNEMAKPFDYNDLKRILSNYFQL